MVGQVAWVEGQTLPSEPTYARLPEASPEIPDPKPHEADCPLAFGTLGFANGAICTIPPAADGPGGADPALLPRDRPDGPLPNLSVQGTHGAVFLYNPRPTLLQGAGATLGPVYPPFLDQRPPTFEDGGFDMFAPTVQRLVDAHRTGTQPLSSGHDYRQALELAIALKLSAQEDNRRVQLPLQGEDRNRRAFPHPYRMFGGDKAGWTDIVSVGLDLCLLLSLL